MYMTYTDVHREDRSRIPLGRWGRAQTMHVHGVSLPTIWKIDAAHFRQGWTRFKGQTMLRFQPTRVEGDKRARQVREVVRASLHSQRSRRAEGGRSFSN
jgi:hypothetical protein